MRLGSVCVFGAASRSLPARLVVLQWPRTTRMPVHLSHQCQPGAFTPHQPPTKLSFDHCSLSSHLLPAGKRAGMQPALEALFGPGGYLSEFGRQRGHFAARELSRE